MTSLCLSDPQSAGFIGSMTRFVDCRVESFGSGAFQALAQPGSTLSLVLTGFLTIFIAVIGYNLLLGRSFTIRSGTIAALRVGVVLALATSWPAYHTLVYDVATDGPAQIVGELGRSAGLPGSDGTLIQRLDGADAALVQLSVLGPGIPTVLQQQDEPPPPFAGFSAFALGGSRILYLLTAILGIAGVRVVTGLMLGLGPFFISFVMFDNTRSLFEGWVRVLAGAALAAIGVSIVLGLELSLLEPWLSTILAQRMAGEALPSVPTELFVVTGSFAIIALAVVGACARLAGAFRLAPWIGRGEDTRAADPQGATASPAMLTSNVQNRDERSRAAMVADVLVAMQRREGGVRAPAMANQVGLRASDSYGFSARHGERAAGPIGRSLTRRAQIRASASAGRRDSR